RPFYGFEGNVGIGQLEPVGRHGAGQLLRANAPPAPRQALIRSPEFINGPIGTCDTPPSHSTAHPGTDPLQHASLSALKPTSASSFDTPVEVAHLSKSMVGRTGAPPNIFTLPSS